MDTLGTVYFGYSILQNEATILRNFAMDQTKLPMLHGASHQISLSSATCKYFTPRSSNLKKMYTQITCTLISDKLT